MNLAIFEYLSNKVLYQKAYLHTYENLHVYSVESNELIVLFNLPFRQDDIFRIAFLLLSGAVSFAYSYHADLHSLDTLHRLLGYNSRPLRLIQETELQYCLNVMTHPYCPFLCSMLILRSEAQQLETWSELLNLFPKVLDPGPLRMNRVDEGFDYFCCDEFKELLLTPRRDVTSPSIIRIAFYNPTS